MFKENDNDDLGFTIVAHLWPMAVPKIDFKSEINFFLVNWR